MQKMDPKDPLYLQLVQKLQTDKSTTSGILPPVINNLDTHINNLKNTLALPLYATAEAEYQRIIATEAKVKNWYQLLSNINNCEQLANWLNRQALYEVLYRNWSGTTHGTDILQNKLSSDGQIFQIRFVKDAQPVTNYAITLLLMTFQLMIIKRIPIHAEEHKIGIQQ